MEGNMKRIISTLLALILCFSLVACKTTETLEVEAEKTEVTEPEPTVTATPEPTIEPTPVVTEAPKEIHWTEEFYVDDFGDPTSESYIRGLFSGRFSNSATSGSQLDVCFFMEKELAYASYDMFSIRLLEYGNHRADFHGSDADDVSIKVKIDDVVTEDEADYILENDGEIYIKRGNKIFKAVIDALNQDKEISFVITIGIYGSLESTYRFDIDANGLEDIDHNWVASM